jgi:hypothetical protein
MHVWHAVCMQYANSVCLWHACSILVYVTYVASVMQVSVACVQLCFLCGPCIHGVCVPCMCIELMAFLHVVQYACAFMNVCNGKCAAYVWHTSGMYAVHIQPV